MFDPKKILALVDAQMAARPLSTLVKQNRAAIVGGKMLRAQLSARISAALHVAETDAIRMGAAVELVHGASLLHDDVIDGASLRRGNPSFWKKHGTNGAILMGDALIFEALDLLQPVGTGELLPLLIELGREVCEAEACQELLWRGEAGTWAQCLKIARGKTGALFAFAACAPAYQDLKLQAALKEAGYLLGTAYQLYDDLADESSESKTAGTDQARGKITAITAVDAPTDLATEIADVLNQADELLRPWPVVAVAWTRFLSETLAPLLGV